MDGIGPDHLRIKELIARAGRDGVKEVILATNPTIEGEGYGDVHQQAAAAIGGADDPHRPTAYPVGGDLKYADEVTLLRAFEGRRSID